MIKTDKETIKYLIRVIDSQIKWADYIIDNRFTEADNRYAAIKNKKALNKIKDELWKAL